MESIEATRRSKPGDVKNLSGKLSQIIPKYPAYGKQLALRIQFKNPPTLIIIEVGGADDWRRAKNWQRHPDFTALVLTPDIEPHKLIWPVQNCNCLIEWGAAAPESLIIKLTKSLKIAGANDVYVFPLFVDHHSPSHLFDPKTQKFVQVRENMKFYRGPMGANNVA